MHALSSCPDGAWLAVAEQLGWVRDEPGLATGNSRCRPGRYSGIEDVIDACLLGRQPQVIGQDDARPGQQLPAPGRGWLKSSVPRSSESVRMASGRAGRNR